jgi:hypothetical protein
MAPGSGAGYLPRSAPPYAQRSAPPSHRRQSSSMARQSELYAPWSAPTPDSGDGWYQPSTVIGPGRAGRPDPSTEAATGPDDTPTGTNGVASVALFFGIIGGSLIAIVLGFVGRARARTTGRGKGIATAGLVLGLLWLAAEAGIAGAVWHSQVATVVRQNTTPAAAPTDPGCAAVEQSGAVATMDADARAGNMTKLVTDFRALSATMTAAQAKTGRTDAAAAMKVFAADLTSYANSVSKGQALSQDEVNKFVADAAAVDRACAP